MYIAYRTSSGNIYASLAECTRDGEKIEKKYIENLGRILDKEKGIYRNRERGVFTYDIKTGKYGTVAPDYVEPPKRKQGKYLKISGKKRSRASLECRENFVTYNGRFYYIS